MWQSYHELLVRLVDGDDNGVPLNGSPIFREIGEHNKRSIVFCDLETDEPVRQVIFLIAPRFGEDRLPKLSAYDASQSAHSS